MDCVSWGQGVWNEPRLQAQDDLLGRQKASACLLKYEGNQHSLQVWQYLSNPRRVHALLNDIGYLGIDTTLYPGHWHGHQPARAIIALLELQVYLYTQHLH